MQLTPPPDRGLSVDEDEPLPVIDLKPLRQRLRSVAQTALMVVIVVALWQLVFVDGVSDGSSMAPAVAADQRILASRLTYVVTQPKRSELVVVRDLRSSGATINRVAGLPGDTVELRGLQIVVNGQLVGDPSQGFSLGAVPGTITRDQLFVLKPGEYFVLTDNLPLNATSAGLRTSGLVSASNILGRAWLSYWPPDAIGLVKTP